MKKYFFMLAVVLSGSTVNASTLNFVCEAKSGPLVFRKIYIKNFTPNEKEIQKAEVLLDEPQFTGGYDFFNGDLELSREKSEIALYFNNGCDNFYGFHFKTSDFQNRSKKFRVVFEYGFPALADEYQMKYLGYKTKPELDAVEGKMNMTCLKVKNL